MSGEFDPVRFGQLIATVEQLQVKVDGMDTDIKELLKLANQSRGGFWVGMSIASFLGGVITFIAGHVFPKIG